jgi:hypothetical protein
VQQPLLADVLRRINDHPASRHGELLPLNWMSGIGPRLTTWALQQVVSFLGYTGRAAKIAATAESDPSAASTVRRSTFFPADWSHSNRRRPMSSSRIASPG